MEHLESYATYAGEQGDQSRGRIPAAVVAKVSVLADGPSRGQPDSIQWRARACSRTEPVESRMSVVGILRSPDIGAFETERCLLEELSLIHI